MSGLSGRSQNGWPLIERTDCVPFEVHGWVGYAANSDVALLADELLTCIDTGVETITLGKVRDDWSHTDPRPVRGQSVVTTNHASGTAFDFNALEHSRGVKGTWSKDELHEIGLILNSMTDDGGRPVWRWGEHYQHAPTDGMHFEINATWQQVHQAAQKLRKRKLAMALVKIDTDAFLDYQDVLSEDASAVFGKPAGHRQSLRYMLTWGGARGKLTERQIHDVAGQVREVKAQVTALTVLVEEILHQVTPPADGFGPAVTS